MQMYLLFQSIRRYPLCVGAALRRLCCWGGGCVATGSGDNSPLLSVTTETSKVLPCSPLRHPDLASCVGACSHARVRTPAHGSALALMPVWEAL